MDAAGAPPACARERRRADERFDPAAALAGAGRYLQIAEERFGDEELAVVSYHMGIGNLETALERYGEDDASWAQVYFDSAPDSNESAYRFLYGLGDDSATYLWRVFAARDIMRRHRSGTLGERPPGRLASGDDEPLPADAGLRCGAADCTLAAGASATVEALGEGVRELAGADSALTVARSSGPLARDPPSLREPAPGRRVPVHARPDGVAGADPLGARRRADRRDRAGRELVP